MMSVPNSLPALRALADQYRVKGDLAQARQVCLQALQQFPDDTDTVNYLGLLEFHLGNLATAVRLVRQAVERNPASSAYRNNLANILFQLRLYADARNEFEEALRLDPKNTLALRNLGWLLQDEGRTAEAEQCYRRILEIHEDPGIRIRLATMLPVVSQSAAKIAGLRKRFEDNIATLLEQPLTLDDPFEEVGTTNFYLAYHGLVDKDLQIQIARLYTKSCPSLQYTAPHCETPGGGKHQQHKIRVGFISRFFSDHSIGKTSRGIIAKLSRERFRVVVFFLETPNGKIGEFIANSADEVVQLPVNLAAARELISKQALDVLYYPDIGMDSFTYFLAFSRLAPVQCTSFGHPDTTGIPALDYFISTQCYDPEPGSTHYSERLVRLEGVESPAYYYEPDAPPDLKPRSHFGLNEEDHVYICPQHLFKLHPDFDACLAGILRADASGRVVLIEGMHRYWRQLLRERFAAAMPDVLERIVFVPRQSSADFFNLIAVSDVMLDTMYFCGQNTTNEGLAAGTPIVTLPGPIQRSRHTMCFLRAMGLMECVARDKQEYIAIAVRIGTDHDYREQLRQRIRETRAVIWEQEEVVREYERFFISSLQRATGEPGDTQP